MKLIILDIGGTSIKYAYYYNGALREFSECATEAYKGGAHVLRKAIEIIRNMGFCDGIGISTAGLVDSEKGIIRYANDNIPGYSGMEIRKVLEQEFSVPVVVENDVNSSALGEGHYGGAKGKKDYLCLTYGTGVGGAIILDGKIFKGCAGFAGEFGRMIIHGKGQKGCYEDYASTTALLHRVKEVAPWIMNGKQIFENFNCEVVQKAVDEWIQEVVHGLISLIYIFNPRLIILGGGVMEQTYIVESVKEKVISQIIPSFKDVEIVQAKLGNKAGLWGAVHLVQENIRIRISN